MSNIQIQKNNKEENKDLKEFKQEKKDVDCYMKLNEGKNSNLSLQENKNMIIHATKDDSKKKNFQKFIDSMIKYGGTEKWDKDTEYLNKTYE